MRFHATTSFRCDFGIAFDIDGVILRGRVPIGGSPQALRRLYGNSGELKVPYLFLTNGGGVPETKRAKELSELLGVNIMPSQVVQGHSPFRNLLKKFENEFIIATGKGDPALVMSEYGFKKVLSVEEYASYFENIDPVFQYKRWKTTPISDTKTPSMPRCDVSSERIKAAFVVSDPVDWGRDIQVLCDVLRSGNLPGDANRSQPPLYFAADDLEYQAAFPTKRLGLGAFRTALESIFNRINPKSLEYVSYGKPNPFVFKNAEALLRQLQSSSCLDHSENNGMSELHPFRTLYMIGDNPSVDIKGAQQTGHPWFSILTRTGVFRGNDNDAEFPADLVVDTVEEAVDFILKRECIS
ncbi:HAD-superfamily hydrolase, subfamily IIA, CECR5 [Corchorus olitorius]|uniref:HAD-superfamily hydrolase, subfamily IIA, CECR5 n=1 Tax=Corchorus olitorius TaxID=93759 RepID=A0A1R3IEW2_9ROSI|nr:HAD-superfamily hydrolase, subfamily IIA, CECR5 [Corchorus olitorius]